MNGGNGSIDYNGEGVITGGIFVAAGSSEMAQNFGNSSTQGVMMAAVGMQTAENVISLKDSNGKELISWTPDKEYQSVIVSCPEVVQGETYTLTAGSSVQEITMDSLVYGSGGMTGGMGGRPGGQRGGGWMNDGAVPGEDGKMGGGRMNGGGAPGGDEQMGGRPGGMPGQEDTAYI